MQRIELAVAQDHIESLARVRNPIIAVEELIWNGLDADATKVEVGINLNEIDGLVELRVKDNGNGIRLDHCEQAFGKLGGSPKLGVRSTPKGRVPHGRSGKGRFRAFGIGGAVSWISRYKTDGQIREFEIQGKRVSLCQFNISDEKTIRGKSTGVEVTVSEIEQSFLSLTNSKLAALELSRRLALYLKKYPGIQITYDGQVVDPVALEDYTATYQLTLVNLDEVEYQAELTVIEWKVPAERALFLCDESGFALEERSPGIQAPGFKFTAYLKSALIQELVEENAFGLETLHPVVSKILEKTKEALRHHFRGREASRAKDLVKQWQEENVYPFDTTVQDPISKIEREVFDVCAIKVHEFLPGFDKAEAKSKQLTFRLIREALEKSPNSLQTILREVLNLPQEQKDELARILGKTRLAAIINAAKTVVDRLEFLTGLDPLLFGDFKKTLLERRHLHRILVQELWLFGEQYLLGVDDESLKSLLNKHIQILERDDLAPEDVKEAKDLEGVERILDLMLYRRYPQFTPNKFEHLVIELKRPTCRIGKKEISQIEEYAFSVAKDERFDKLHTKWTFLLIGNDLDDFADARCRVKGQEYGHIHASEDGSLNIHVRKWTTIIDEAKWRYNFFREKLEYQVAAAEGIEYLRSRHHQHLPPTKEGEEKGADSNGSDTE